MSDEKARILQMIEDGKISAADALELLNALSESENKSKVVSTNITNRFLRVRVDNAKSKVNVNIPLSLLKATSKLVNMGMSFIPDEARQEMHKKGIDLSKIDIEELVTLIESGLVDGKLVDVDAENGRTKVEVYVE